jgi:dihydrofolate reductase
MVTIIAAIAKNNALGKNNDLIWHLPADLKRFKQRTTGHYILMGRNTFESIGKPLPNRTTVIITRNKEYYKDGCLIAHSLQEALDLAKEESHVFIIGGAQVYEHAMENNLADVLDITLVHKEFDADVFFPKIDDSIWKETTREDFEADEKNKFAYSFVRYEKRVN